MASRHENLSSGSTGQILTDSSINFMNDSVNILPNDKVTNNTSSFISTFRVLTVAICGREIYHN